LTKGTKEEICINITAANTNNTNRKYKPLA